MNSEEIINKVAKCLIEASTSFRQDKIKAYEEAIKAENNPQSKWVLETILENAKVAETNKSPMCDDTGIPHLFLEIGTNNAINGDFISNIYEGIKKGLRELPGRPMAVKGNEVQRIEQSIGLYDDPDQLQAAPIQIKLVDRNTITLHIIMQGGGPAIRGRSFRIFHKHDISVVKNQIVDWAKEAVSQLGCSPCTLAIGIGRSHFEASSLMMEAQVYGRYDEQSDLEKEITEEVNKSNVGALGLGGMTSVLGTFLKVGPQRASGVRIVCIRPCCCFEPRIASVELREF